MSSYGSFVAQRVLAALVTVLLAVTLAFGLARVAGDPVRQILGETATPQQIAEKREELGLDRSIPAQYVTFIGDIATGNFGRSLQYNEANLSLIGDRIGASLKLVVAGMVLGFVLGFPLGLLAALRRDSIWDRLSVAISMVGQSIPAFWLGLMLVLVFAVTLGWFPAGQDGGLDHLVLPAIAMATVPLAQVARITRSTALEVLTQDYVSAAKARGFGTKRVILRHVIRGTALPLITLLGLLAGLLFSGAVTIEIVFGWPGLGSLVANAIEFRDFTMIQAFVVLGAVVFVAINLVVDLLYGFIDPRVRVA